MAKVVFGNHSSVLVPACERERIRAFYCDVLGGTVTRADPERDFVRLGDDFYIAFLYGDVADASEFLRSARSIWLELKSDDVEATGRRILASGLVRKLELPDPHRPCRLPGDFAMPAGGLNLKQNLPALVEEERLVTQRLPAATAFARANHIDRVVIDGVGSPSGRTLGIVSAGKAYLDLRQALADLGLDEATCARLGIRVYKPGLIWPMDRERLVDFAAGHRALLVVEEKRPVMEDQIARHLYAIGAERRPQLLGKQDLSGATLLSAVGELGVPQVRRAIVTALAQIGIRDAQVQTHADGWQALETRALETGGAIRPAYFCSGCPHNTSTKTPDGALALGGIGCHGLAAVVMDRNTMQFVPMGHEGSPFVGVGPFTEGTRHVFQNMGDGTYSHSGVLAIRAAVAAKANITYKVLYNDAVAMTGGQTVGERPEGHSVLQIMNSLKSEGVAKLVIVTDEPHKYDGVALADGVTVHHRDELDTIQRQFREIKGCTAIIYDQTCATEKRRRRKRGKLATPDKTVVINELVCEGCGDCSTKSNCLSVEPVETEFGRKRRINQSTCNKDYSCVNGFCPSFVTVEGGKLKKPKKEKKGDLSALPSIPEPVLPVAETAWGIVVGGVGGTGVITIGSLLGMAAHLDGKGVITQDAGGLAQKGGATWSHIQIANRPEAIYTTKVDTAKADLVIGCDAIVAAHKYTLAVMQPGRTFVALNTHSTPTASFVNNPDWQFPGANCDSAIATAVGAGGVGSFDAEQVATQLLGDSIYTNPLMLGYAWQKGRVPLTYASLMRAMELNGVQVENNKAAFEWGRRCAHDLAAVQALFQAAQVIQFVKKPSLAALVNAVAMRQGVKPIGARMLSDVADRGVRERMARIKGERDDHARTLAEREAVIERLRRENASLRERLRFVEETGMLVREPLPPC